MVQPTEGAFVKKTTLFFFHMKRFRVRIPGEVNSLYSLSYLQIHYYKHYNVDTYLIDTQDQDMENTEVEQE